MEIGFVIGWVGVGFGLAVPIPQLIKIIKTKSLADISMGTYIFLVCCLICYLIHAIHIKSPVFTTAQSVNIKGQIEQQPLAGGLFRADVGVTGVPAFEFAGYGIGTCWRGLWRLSPADTVRLRAVDAPETGA